MKRSSERVLTTHAGSLFRPPDLLEMLHARVRGDLPDREAFEERLRIAVDDVVARQAESGIDVVDDGELSKADFVDYIAERWNGLERTNPNAIFPERRVDYPEYHAEQMTRQVPLPAPRPLCVGPLGWREDDAGAVAVDIENLMSAIGKVDVEEGFLPAPSPGILAMRIPNLYYPSDEEYLMALAEVLRREYRAIVDAGLVLQIDAPELPMAWVMQFGAERFEDYRRTCALRNEALNHALAGIPEESVRYHICWGNSEEPHTLDIDLRSVLDLVLQVHAQAYSIEAANPRHAHEWEIWRDVKLPEGKILIPGVIDSTTNFVEHPELVAQRIVQFANLVGRENVIAGVDCGFGTSARLTPRVHPTVVWGKLRALSDGAAIASSRLWG